MKRRFWRPLQAALLYLALGAAWISLSDRLVYTLSDDPARLTELQTAKGWLFVLITAIMAYALVKRACQERHRTAQAQARIELLSNHDSLTGLPNRTLAADRLKMAVSHAERAHTQVAVLFIDVDHFKSVNDSLGHPAGDELLKAVASRLQEEVGDRDSVCRYGGDEYLILLSDIESVDSVAQLAEQLLTSLAQAYEIDSQTLIVSASIGIALYPSDDHQAEGVLRKADIAMYQAKEAGRNTYRFYAEFMNAEASARLTLRNDISAALQHDEFELYYQPQVHVRDGTVFGTEALLRWNSPSRGLIGPNTFISVAEESGQIEAIGNWVVHQACRQTAAWQRAGLAPLRIAVNVSAVQFRRGNFVEVVASALHESGLPPALLELELTESILIRDTENALEAVRQLKQLGVRLSIDDFGTGYSSLAYIKRFPVDKVKIDKSFVRNIAHNKEDSALVEAIIRMAQTLGLTTLAEGVEQEDVLACLDELGCEDAQGYYFAKPMPAAPLSAYLADYLSVRRHAHRPSPGPH